MAPLRCANAPSSARFFVQLAKRSAAPTTGTTTTTAAHHVAPSQPVLEVFAPRWTGRRNYSSSPVGFSNSSRPLGRDQLRGCTALAPPRGGQSGTEKQDYTPRNLSAQQRRTFVSTAPRRATTCVHNAVQDEEGNDMFLDITDRAGKRLSQIMKKDSNPNLALRIQVESGGCHGFQYLMSLVTLPQPQAQAQVDGEGTAPPVEAALGEDDTIFQYAADEAAAGTEVKEGMPKVVIDQPSLELLKGSKVDFTVELIGSQFKIADNPYATSACGCGTSFDIKM